ncbi:MAG TPA: hypothetical protein VMV91_02535 [Rhodocyclaceae bacterium]|nr:hypothetical protein [Rhodocyclaceae bacterium]
MVEKVDRLLSIAREVEAEVEANLKRAQVLRQAVLSKSFQVSPSMSERALSQAGLIGLPALEL